MCWRLINTEKEQVNDISEGPPLQKFIFCVQETDRLSQGQNLISYRALACVCVLRCSSVDLP